VAGARFCLKLSSLIKTLRIKIKVVFALTVADFKMMPLLCISRVLFKVRTEDVLLTLHAKTQLKILDY
jgi:hypothetical protein